MPLLAIVCLPVSPHAPPLFIHLCLFILCVSVSAWDCLSGPRCDTEGYTPSLGPTVSLQGPRGILLTHLGPHLPLGPCDSHTQPSVSLRSLFIPVYFNWLAFPPPAMVDVGDAAHLLCLAFRIFTSKYSSAHISHPHLVPQGPPCPSAGT